MRQKGRNQIKFISKNPIYATDFDFDIDSDASSTNLSIDNLNTDVFICVFF